MKTLASGRIRWVTILILLTLLPISCEQAPREGTEITVLEGATVIDGTGAAPQENAVLVIEGQRIQALGKAGEVTIPESARRVDLDGKFVIPGLINLHCHVGSVKGLTSSAANYTEENVVTQLDRYLTYGVTTVLSLGTDPPLMYELRARQRQGNLAGATVFTAGWGFKMKGSYGPPDTPYQVETPEDVHRFMDELAAQKPDATKVWVDDHFGERTKIRPELYRAFIEAAHEKGLRTFAHVYYLEDARSLVEAGVDVLAHSIRDREVDDAFIQLATERGIYLVPTLARELSTFVYADQPDFLDDPAFTRHEDPEVVATLKSDDYVKKVKSDPHLGHYRASLEMAQKNLKKLHEGGVKIGFATDSGPPGRIQGYFEHVELELMVEAGLTPGEALAAATGQSAECLGQGNNLGTLAPDRQADFVVLDANPLDDITHSRRIASVWQRGVQVRGPLQ